MKPRKRKGGWWKHDGSMNPESTGCKPVKSRPNRAWIRVVVRPCWSLHRPLEMVILLIKPPILPIGWLVIITIKSLRTHHPPFAVFGLVDSSCAHFCHLWAACGLGSRVPKCKTTGALGDLEFQSAKRLVPLAMGDGANGNQDGAFQKWCEEIIVVLQQQALGEEACTVHKQNLPAMSSRRCSAIQPGRVIARITGGEKLLLHPKEPSLSSAGQRRSVLHFFVSALSSGPHPSTAWRPRGHLSPE